LDRAGLPPCGNGHFASADILGLLSFCVGGEIAMNARIDLRTPLR
jgi:hypothetical protein